MSVTYFQGKFRFIDLLCSFVNVMMMMLGVVCSVRIFKTA